MTDPKKFAVKIKLPNAVKLMGVVKPPLLCGRPSRPPRGSRHRPPLQQRTGFQQIFWNPKFWLFLTYLNYFSIKILTIWRRYLWIIRSFNKQFQGEIKKIDFFCSFVGEKNQTCNAKSWTFRKIKNPRNKFYGFNFSTLQAAK